MGRIKRWGKEIIDFPLGSWGFLNENWNRYVPLLKRLIEDKTVFIVKEQKSPCWVEAPLSYWFSEHYKELGFEYIEVERSQKYYSLKREICFYGYPDFLARKNGKWLKLEVECFSSCYRHPIGYADVMFCYDKTKDILDKEVEIISFKELMGYKEIIAVFELPDFLYIYDNQFRKEQREWMMTKLGKMFKRTEENTRIHGVDAEDRRIN